MAELLGAIASGITLAALFKGCIEAFDLIQTSRHQEADLKKLKLRLNIEKCRLYIWGESMGLADTLDLTQERPIDTFRFPEVVREILEVVFQLFHDSHKIKDKYGCRSATAEDIDHAGPISSLAATFSDFAVRSAQSSKAPKAVQKMAWVIYDRKKFGALVAEIKDLVDSLQGITSPSVPVARQAGTMRRKIERIRDAETLSLIAEVCSEDHPDIAGAASTKADTISLTSTHQRQVVAWTESVQDGQPTDRMSPDLESLTVTELKHIVLQMKQERQERGDPPAFASAISLLSEPEMPLSPPLPNLRPVAEKSGLDFKQSLHSIYTQPAPHFTDPWGLRTSVNSSIHPYSPYQPAANVGSFTNPFHTPSASASTYSTTSYRDQASYADSVSGSITDYSSVTSEADYESRTLSRPSQLLGQNFSSPTPPQAMISQFTSHMSSNQRKKHKCKVCDKRFTRPSYLQTHMYSHTGEKPFACPYKGCGRHFSVVSNLRRHKRIHKHERAAGDVDMDED